MAERKLFPNDIKRSTTATNLLPQPKNGSLPGKGTAGPGSPSRLPVTTTQIHGQQAVYRPGPISAARPSPSLDRAKEPVSLMGRIGKYFELKSTTNGTPLAVFSVASAQPCLDEAGTWTKKTVWHKIVVWGDKALAIGDQLQKGARVYVEGKFKTKEWIGQDNNPRVSTELVAREVRFLDLEDHFANVA
jgi:single-strand DNA-binding protein